MGGEQEEAGVADDREEGLGEQGGPLPPSIGRQVGQGAGVPVAGRCWPKEQESEAACSVEDGSVGGGDIGWGLGRMGQVDRDRTVLKMLLGRRRKKAVRRWGMRSWTGN